MLEFKILNYIVDAMDSNGAIYKFVDFSVDEALLQGVNAKNKTPVTLEDLKKATNRCISNEWLITRTLGDSKYSNLGITQKGIGAARSKQKSDEKKASRSFLKKTSDYIMNHQGLFIVLGSLIAIVSLCVAMFWRK